MGRAVRTLFDQFRMVIVAARLSDRKPLFLIPIIARPCRKSSRRSSSSQPSSFWCGCCTGNCAGKTPDAALRAATNADSPAAPVPAGQSLRERKNETADRSERFHRQETALPGEGTITSKARLADRATRQKPSPPGTMKAGRRSRPYFPPSHDGTSRLAEKPRRSRSSGTKNLGMLTPAFPAPWPTGRDTKCLFPCSRFLSGGRPLRLRAYLWPARPHLAYCRDNRR